MKIAFYKAEGDWTDKLIRLWTVGTYSHCEIIIDELWYSSSWYDKGVRVKRIKFNPDNWDIIEINNPSKEEEVLNFFDRTSGSEYDLRGIFFSNIFKFGIENKKKYWCSEWCAIALGLEKTRVNPNQLYKILKDKI